MRIARGSGFLLLLPCLWLGCEEESSGGYGPRYEHYGGALSVTCTPSASGGAGGASARVSSPLFVPGDASRPPLKALDCGANGVAIENAGPPANRVNYVILGDGYDQRAVGSVFLGHIARDMRKRFSDPVGQPYGRYRKFVNICALQVPSEHNGIGNGPTAFSCSGNDSTRLASCDTRAAEAALDQLLPESFEVDWRAILLRS
ncbi:MAG: M64 family metallopeptidase [Mesorhizobium sp.]